MKSLWALAAVGVLAAGFLLSLGENVPEGPTPAAATRIVSLAPSITETLVAIGAGDRLAAIDDHCAYPPAVTALPRVGTAFNPNYEGIVAVRPDGIVLPHLQGIPIDNLEKLAPTVALPWTSLEEVTDSIERLGTMVGLEEKAAALAETIRTSLVPRTRPNPPRVLLAFSPNAEGLSEVWFMKQNSLHGKALRSTGALNVVDQPVHGPPVLSLERVLELDPDMVVILVADKKTTPDVITEWEALGQLTAVRNKQVHILEDRGLYVPGPRIIQLSASLKTLIDRYPSEPQETPGRTR